MEGDEAAGTDEGRIKLEVAPDCFVTMIAVDHQEVDRVAAEALDDSVTCRGLMRIACEEVKRLCREPIALDGAELFVGIPAAEEAARQINADERRIFVGGPAQRIETATTVRPDLDDCGRATFSEQRK